MKVVLFCGGMGTRLRGYSHQIPKPLVEVGPMPILWHLMKYYAHFGHKDFIICLGYGGEHIKRFFLEYDERHINDFRYADGGRTIDLFDTDIEEWRITFIDTGLHSKIGERLRRVQGYLDDDEMFLANYADGLTDLDLNEYVGSFRASGKIGCLLTVPAPHTFHVVHAAKDGRVESIEHIRRTPVRVNAGFFVFRRAIFDYLREGEELVLEPFSRLVAEGQLTAVPYNGFWRQMDTFKDKGMLDELIAEGAPPWQVWRRDQSAPMDTGSSA